MTFDAVYLDSFVRTLTDRGIAFASGLTDSEISAAEDYWSFTFPPDLRQLLQHALPVSDGFPDWRSPESESLRLTIEWPFRGMCFDIEHNEFWMDDWDVRPDELDAAKAIAKRAVQNAPFLIPVYSHRYLPADPCVVGNPVFSVYQTDIIFYGFDLAAYLDAEFKVPNPFSVTTEPRAIEFWREIAA